MLLLVREVVTWDLPMEDCALISTWTSMIAFGSHGLIIQHRLAPRW